MTDVAYSQPELTRFELPTGDAPITFDGWFIDSYDNGGGDRTRWAVLYLYRWLPEGSDQLGYIVHTVGHSVIYHQPDSECGKGEAHPVSKFDALYEEGRIEDPDDLEPCDQCDPPEWDTVPEDTEFEVEVVWYRWTDCRTAEALLESGRKPARCRNCFCQPHRDRRCKTCTCDEYEKAPQPLTIPMQRLLARVKARNLDADIIAAMREQKIRL